jgi:1,4-dihydroxy-2-naphthoate octaprenyltransferase
VRRVVAFIRLGRPLFLGGGFVLYGLGAAVAAWSGATIDVGRYLVGQLAVTAFQLMTHYANDYFDYDGDLVNSTPTRWSGGSRVLLAGAVPRGAALIAALVLAAIGLGLTATMSMPVAALYLAMAAGAWCYSAPPLRLCSTGLGELDTACVVTVLVPLAGWRLQSHTGLGVLLLAVWAPALLQAAMLLAIELPDHAGDARSGKRTLVVRLGPRRGSRLYVAVTAAAYLGLPLLVLAGLPLAVAIAAALPAPLAVWRIRRILHGDWRRSGRWESVTFWAVALLVATSAASLVAFVSLARAG